MLNIAQTQGAHYIKPHPLAIEVSIFNKNIIPHKT